MRPEGLVPKPATVTLTGTQAAMLIVNFIASARRPEVGYDHTARTIDEFMDLIDETLPRVKVPVEMLEELLCAVNLRNEMGGPGNFISARDGESFEKFVKSIFRYVRHSGVKLDFNTNYNVIEYKKVEENE